MIERWDIAMFAVMILYIIACPYTKEEEFGIQSTYDILIHRFDLNVTL